MIPEYADIIYQRIQESLDLPDVRRLELEPRDSFPVPEGQGEFVEMPPEEAKKYEHEHSHHSHGHGHDSP